MSNTSVKIMRSYDYCHFEICLGTDLDMTCQEVDTMRKSAALIVDKAVAKYMTAKRKASQRSNGPTEAAKFEKDCLGIAQKEEGDRSPNDQAMLKQYRDEAWRDQFRYDYDYEDNDEDDRIRW